MHKWEQWESVIVQLLLNTNVLYGVIYFNNRQEKEVEQSDLGSNFPPQRLSINQNNNWSAAVNRKHLNTTYRHTGLPVPLVPSLQIVPETVSKSTKLSYSTSTIQSYRLLEYNYSGQWLCIEVSSLLAMVVVDGPGAASGPNVSWQASVSWKQSPCSKCNDTGSSF